jgi:hypothetical protein
MKYLRKFNENSNSKYVDEVLSERETYNTFNALKRMWSTISEDILEETLPYLHSFLFHSFLSS